MRLRSKLALGFLLLLGASAVTISRFSSRLIERTRREDLEAKGAFLTRQFAARNRDAIQRKDEAKLLTALLDVLKDPEVAYGEVLDGNGKIVAHTNLALVGQSDKAAADAAAAQKPDVFFVDRPSAADPVLDVVFKVKAQDAESFFVEASAPAQAGVLKLGLSLKPSLEFTRRMRAGMNTIVAAITLAALLLAFLFSALLTRPIGKLMDGIEEARKGNLGYKVDVGSSDEIGQVGSAFNKMTAELKTAKDELIRVADAKLEEKIVALALANEELKDAQDRIVRAEKLAAIGKLASGVGHELRNPLGAIRNALYYLRDTLKDTPSAKEDPTIMEFIGLADREIQSATHIIGDLLDYSRVPKLNPVPLDINALVLEAKGIIEKPANVTVVEEFDAALPKPSADREKIRQVFLNLIQNAVHAMPKGGELRITTKLDGAMVVVAFKDAGTGITPDNLKKLFEPLFTTKAKGTGLGLAISQGIVEKHGGKIIVDSKVGAGTTFTVRIPKEGRPMAPETLKEAANILVVDDQAGMRLTLKGILAKRGYQVSVAEDGPQAIEAARAQKFKIIIMDIKMPGMTGVEALAQIKESNPDAAVIMMTAYAAPEEISQAFREGVYTVLHKPLDMEKVMGLISECIEDRALVLVVDDSEETRHILKGIFEKKGYLTAEAVSGEDCLQKLVERHYQVVLLDVHLPGMNGVATLEEIKRIRPDTTVVMMTGDTEGALVRQALQSGSIAVVPKPLEIEKLLATIDACLKDGPR